MANGTQNAEDLFLAGERLRKCREWRGLTRAQLVEAVERLPANNGKTRSEKHIGYLENGMRPLSLEYAHLLADALHVRVEYLMMKDDYRNEVERAGSCAAARGERRGLIFELIKLHGYEVNDITNKTPVLKDEDGKEYKRFTLSMVSPRGAERYLSHEDLLQMLERIDDYVEYQCATQFRQFIDGVKNIYEQDPDAAFDFDNAHVFSSFVNYWGKFGGGDR